MTSVSTLFTERKYLLAVGAVGIVAAFGLSAFLARADVGPAVITSTTNTSNAVVTSAVIGTNVFAGASVASSTASSTPTGTVTFSKFNNLACSGTPTVQSGVALSSGMASSSAITMTGAGLSYLVTYNGDATNTPSVSSCTVVNPVSAAVTVTNALSASSVNVGSSVTSHATLAGNTALATGTVAYNVYANNTCTTATTSPASVTVTNGVVPTSAAVTFNQVGSYYWQAVYSGDNANAAATSSCSLLAVAAVTTPVPPVATTTAASGTISGTVFNDTNKNKIIDTGEAGIAGVTIKLSVLQTNWWLSLVKIKKYTAYATTTTNASGVYAFSNLPAGVYQVEELKTKGVSHDGGVLQPIPLLTNAGVAGLNFANKVNATSTKPDDKGKDNNKNDDHRIASSTKSVNINASIHATLKGLNGNHFGQNKDR